MPIKPELRRLYPHNWRLLSWAIRFSRGKGRCECTGQCGDHHPGGRCPERHGKPALTHRGRVLLTTAHLDHDPTNNVPENLRGFCQRCHLRYDRFQHAKERRKTRLRGQLSLPL